MRTIRKFIFLAVFSFVSNNLMHAQTTETKLNQIELMKQFVGNWKCDLGTDTTIVGENIAFETGLVCNSRIIVKGKVINTVKQLYGYDKKDDKFIIAELIESSLIIEICQAWFTSETTGELIVVNPDNVTIKYKFEFRTPDLIIQTAMQDNKIVKEIVISHIKEN